MRQSTSIWRHFDLILFGMMVLLIIFGLLMIRSATLGAVDPDLIRRVPDQILFAFIGLATMLAFTAIDYRLLGGLHTWLYLTLIVMLFLVLTVGVVGDAGAQRWISLGFIRIQPSEIGKIVIIITLGHLLATRYHEMDSLTTVLRSLAHLAVPLGLIFIQPDLGTTIVFIVIWAAMVWAAGLRMKHIAMFFTVILLLMPLAWSQMQGYQRERIVTFIRPESNPDAQFNITQARIAIGTGGILGKGYANGTQSQLRFLRVRHTDFIYSVIAEEFGFVGSVAVMVGLAIIILRILRGARTASDELGSLICYGVAAIIFFQTTVSIGMNLGVLPVTGLTLPLISAGGTSLLSTMAGIGLAESVIVRRRRV